MVYHSSFVDDEEITKSYSTDIVDEAITFFRANVFFRNFDIKSSADKLLIYLTFYINIALKRLEGCRTLAEGTKAIINLGLEKVPVPGEPGFPFPGLFAAPQSQQEAAVQKLSETESRGNKRKIVKCGLSIEWNSKQMVVGICKEKVYEHHYTLKYLFDVILRYSADDQNLEV
ncbi:Actin-related protein 2/3 complex subunit 3 [Castilleja foliolosa]|uniref:Actin-related protein 2/3 complex subunit 3 n=1 Tax=Castilleja foliolosa TaxID=1961234 RepID=A0ABD3C5N7_9LAMI